MDYYAYNLMVRCELPLPDLFPAAATSSLLADNHQHKTPDIVVRDGAVAFPSRLPLDVHRFQIARDEAWLFWPDVGAFHLRAGREIVVDAAKNVARSTLGACLAGPVLAIALYQRGSLLLHASAVALSGSADQRENIDERGAVGFLGHSGEGKSTMAASLHARGHWLLADDFIAVPACTSDDKLPLIAPGVAQLNLWPSSLRALETAPNDGDLWPQVWTHEDKRARRIDAGFATRAVPLRKLYVLETADAIACRSLSAAQALTQLVRHSYCAGFLPPAEMAQQFKQFAALIERVSVCRLSRPRDLNHLDAVAQHVEADFQTR